MTKNYGPIYDEVQKIPEWAWKAGEKPRRKPGPKPKVKLVKPVQPKPKLHVKVNLTGSVEFDLEGLEAAKLMDMLRQLKLDEVIEFVDPWASGAEIRYDVEVTDWAATDSQWKANETTGTIELRPWRFR